jgi:hypothetical protein
MIFGILSKDHPVFRLIILPSNSYIPVFEQVKSYNYGIPTSKRQQNSSHRVHYQHETNFNHPSIFVPSSHSQNDVISYAKPAEIYVYARKRPLLSSETNFHDTISIPDNKHIIMSENKSNLDCTPLLKQVFIFVNKRLPTI